VARPNGGPKVRSRNGRHYARFHFAGKAYERVLSSRLLEDARLEAEEVYQAHVNGVTPPRSRARLNDLTPLVPLGSPGVYALLNRAGQVKIGKATNIKRRVGQLQIAEPFPLRLVAVLSPNPAMEREFHRRMRHLPRTGEWFVPEQRLIDLICDARGRY
jgi:hypothetical protein